MTAQTSDKDLLTILSQHVLARFARLGDPGLLAVALSLPPRTECDDPLPNPGHPACREYVNTDYCRESWQLHLFELSLQPETHWHKCDYDRLCALIPVVHSNRCVAVIRLACTPSTPEEVFERQVELLDILVKDFVSSEADFLDRLPATALPAPDLGMLPADATARPAQQRPRHPQILRALEYIDAHLSDPRLSVGRVAREMDAHPNYLSHLFADQLGQRMSRYVAVRRVERAKHLLATTKWQIKRIARETGHANPNWFCYVFRALTGLTPGAYRRKLRVQSDCGPNR